MSLITTVGDRVQLSKKNMVGIVRFIGEINSKTDIYYGIELSESKGRNNGCIGSTQYFKCKSKRGIFVKRTAIISTTITKHNKSTPRVTVGDTVQCTKAQCKGIIKFIGTPFSIKKSGIMYGIQLLYARGENDGTLRGRQYFKCDAKHGVFIEATGFTLLNTTQHKLPKNKQHRSSLPMFNIKKKKPKYIMQHTNTHSNGTYLPDENNNYPNGTIQLSKTNGTIQLSKTEIMHHTPTSPAIWTPTVSITTVGDRVRLHKQNLIGVVKFIGEIEGKQDIYYGIELDTAKGTNGGYINGVWYFECQPNRGLFVKKEEIQKTNKKHNEDMPRVMIGDTVQCSKQHCKGTIRFIGTLYHMRQKGTLYGIQLSKPNGKNNGSINGRKYFKCKSRYGVFLDATGFKQAPFSPNSNSSSSGSCDSHMMNEMNELRRMLTEKDEDLEHQRNMYFEVEDMLSEQQRINRILKQRIASMDSGNAAADTTLTTPQPNVFSPPAIHIEDSNKYESCSLVDMESNAKHQDMFQDFINDVYDLCLDDYTQIINQMGHQFKDLNQNFSQNELKNDILNGEILSSALQFYSTTIDAMHKHLFDLCEHGTPNTNTSFDNSVSANEDSEMKKEEQYNLYFDSSKTHRKSLPALPTKHLPKTKALPVPPKRDTTSQLSPFLPPSGAFELTFSPQISSTRSADNNAVGAPKFNLITFGRSMENTSTKRPASARLNATNNRSKGANKPRHSVGFSDVIMVDEYELSDDDDDDVLNYAMHADDDDDNDSIRDIADVDDDEEIEVVLGQPPIGKHSKKHFASKSTGFELGSIMLPLTAKHKTQDAHHEQKNDLNDSDDYDGSGDTSSSSSPAIKTSLKSRPRQKSGSMNRVRRNSDTIVWTPTTASANNDSVYMTALANAPQAMTEDEADNELSLPFAEQQNQTTQQKRSSMIIHELLPNNTNEPLVHQSQSSAERPRRNSAPETPTAIANTNNGATFAQALAPFSYDKNMIPPPPPPPPPPPSSPPPDKSPVARPTPPAPPRSRSRSRGASIYSVHSGGSLSISQLQAGSFSMQRSASVSNRSRSHTRSYTAGVMKKKALPQTLSVEAVSRARSASMNEKSLHDDNIQLIGKILGFKSHRWNYENDIVAVFEEQCKKVEYERLVPAVKDVLYPTMLSSLALPAQSKHVTYIAIVKYKMSSFVKRAVYKNKKKSGADEYNNVRRLKFSFSFKTTIKHAINDLVHKLKKNHAKYNEAISKLLIHCYILKVCGREEHIKVDDANNKIISLSNVRNCIRRNDVHGFEFVLLYDENLNILNDNNLRLALRHSYSMFYDTKRANSLKYENLGYNAITKTLVNTIADNTDYLKTHLDHLNHDIEKETEWQQNKIGPLVNNSSQGNFTPEQANFTPTEHEIKWEEIGKDAILLPEFTHPIELRVDSLMNIMLCPRFRAHDTYFTYVLRIELMFGLEVFRDCSWDITIPSTKVSNGIKMPAEFCTFSTASEDLDYASLPREAIWCFTLYGIKKDVAIEQEQKKQEKKKKKKEPKILGAFLNASKNNKNNNQSSHINAPSYEFSLPNTKNSSNNNRKKSNNHISSKSVADDLEQMIGNEPIDDFYSTRPDTARSFKKSFNGADLYESKEEITVDANKYASEPMAWCRLPMIDHRHCLRRGQYQLKLWTCAVFEKIKGGPKIDPYSTGNWKKFGSVRDCNLKKKTSSNSVTLVVDFLWKYSFNVVAPIVNKRRPNYIRRKIKEYKKKEFSGAKVLNDIIQSDGILPMDERDKLLVYSNKEKLMRDAATIPTFLRSVHWLDQESRMEAYDYLEKWKTPKNPEDMIELLRYEFADNRIRLYAINCLNQLDDYTLNRCLLQLVQALKNEPHHSSFLARFLMVRALRNPFQIGHYLFWHLKSEYHEQNMEFVERFGLLLREYLLHLPYYPSHTAINLAKQLYDEHQLINRLKFISLTIKNAKSKKKVSNKHLTNLLQNELKRLNVEIFVESGKARAITLPLNPSYRVSSIQFDKCRFMSSAKVPLWLVFNASDTFYSSTISVMFKCGDDLRQDILTLQLISVMDAFWLSSSIDLNMRTYEVIGTGFQVGMLELILNSKTLNDIGSFNTKAHLKYISSKSKTNMHLDLSMKKSNYARSVAGFSVATWALGIGDRHPDNIMIHENGTYFHIDFGHFLGNFKQKDIGGFVKWKRERTPFVFTNAMKYCIAGKSNKKSNKAYTQFVKLLFNSFCEIRSRYKFFLNLLLLMVPSQIPELITESDVSYFRQILRFDLNDTKEIASYVEATLNLCLSDKNKKFDDMLHKIHHL